MKLRPFEGSKIKPFDKVKTKEEAREIAIEIQKEASENVLTWLDQADVQTYLEELAIKFDLEEEFKENGIL